MHGFLPSPYLHLAYIYSVRKCKDRLVSTFIPQSSLHFGTVWYTSYTTLTLAIMGRKNTSGDSSRRPFATPPATFNLAALFMETSLCSPCGLTFFVLPVPPTTGLPLSK